MSMITGSDVKNKNGSMQVTKGDIQSLIDNLLAMEESLTSIDASIGSHATEVNSNTSEKHLKEAAASGNLIRIIPTGFMLLHNDLERIAKSNSKGKSTGANGWDVLNNLSDKIVPSIALLGTFSFLNKLVKNGMTMDDFASGIASIGKGISTFVTDVAEIIPKLTGDLGKALSNVVLEFGLTKSLLDESKSENVQQMTQQMAAALIETKASEIIRDSGFEIEWVEETDAEGNTKKVPKIKRDNNGSYIFNKALATGSKIITWKLQPWTLTLDTLSDTFMDIWKEYQVFDSLIDVTKRDEVQQLASGYAAALLKVKAAEIIEDSGFTVTEDDKGQITIKKKSDLTINQTMDLVGKMFSWVTSKNNYTLHIDSLANTFTDAWKKIKFDTITADTMSALLKKEKVQELVQDYAVALLKAQTLNMIEDSGFTYDETTGKLTPKKSDKSEDIYGGLSLLGMIGISAAKGALVGGPYGAAISALTTAGAIVTEQGISYLVNKAANAFADIYAKINLSNAAIEATKTDYVKDAVKDLSVALIETEFLTLLADMGIPKDAISQDSNGKWSIDKSKIPTDIFYTDPKWFGERWLDKAAENKGDRKALITFKSAMAENLADVLVNTSITIDETTQKALNTAMGSLIEEFIDNSAEAVANLGYGIASGSLGDGVGSPLYYLAYNVAEMAKGFKVDISLSQFLSTEAKSALSESLGTIFSLNSDESSDIHKAFKKNFIDFFEAKGLFGGKASGFQNAMYEGIEAAFSKLDFGTDLKARDNAIGSIYTLADALENQGDTTVDLSSIVIPDYSTKINEISAAIADLKKAIVPITHTADSPNLTILEYTKSIADKDNVFNIDVKVDSNGNTTSSVTTESSSKNNKSAQWNHRAAGLN